MLNESQFYNICKDKIGQILSTAAGRDLYIYGAGVGGKIFAKVLSEKQIIWKGFIDRNAHRIEEIDGHKVFYLDKNRIKNSFVVVALREYDSDVVEELRRNGLDDKDFYVISAGLNINTTDIVYKGCIIGRYTYGYECLLEYYPLAESIGRYCSINRTAKIVKNHSLDCVTTHSFLDNPSFFSWEHFHERKKMLKKYGKYNNNAPCEDSEIRKNEPVVIGNDVWIGANAVILPGVNIGDGAVIAAGAIVTKNVEPYCIVAGNPARVLRRRFDEDIISKMLEIKWWNWDHDEIEKNLDFFFDPRVFVDRFID